LVSKPPHTERGMDLFDFLYEIWQAKLLFLTIVAVFLATGVASVLVEPDLSGLRRTDNTGAPGGRNYSEQALFRLQLSDKDPLQREPDELIRDLISHAYPDLGLVQLEDALLPEFFAATTGRTMYFEDAAQSLVLAVDLGNADPRDPDDFIGYGQIRAMATPGGLDVSNELYGAFQAAASRQLNAAFEQSERERAVIRQVIERIPVPLVVVPNDAGGASGGSWVDWAAKRVFAGEMFRSDPATRAEDFVLVRVLPPSERVSGFGRQSDLIRSIVVWGMLGIIIAVLAVMFRIGIRRGRGSESA
jgi:hypothetical protein